MAMQSAGGACESDDEAVTEFGECRLTKMRAFVADYAASASGSGAHRPAIPLNVPAYLATAAHASQDILSSASSCE